MDEERNYFLNRAERLEHVAMARESRGLHNDSMIAMNLARNCRRQAHLIDASGELARNILCRLVAKHRTGAV